MANRELHRVYFMMGSNIDPLFHMQMARRHIHSLLKDVRFSTEMWTDPIGMVSCPFLNCMGVGYTTHESVQIGRAIKQIQRKCGDSKGKRRINQVVMDIDMMQYDDTRFHEADWERDYVKQLYSELRQEEKIFR